MNDLLLKDDLRMVTDVVQKLDLLTVMDLKSMDFFRWQMMQSKLDAYNDSVLVVVPTALTEDEHVLPESNRESFSKRLQAFTSREQEILLMIAAGKNNKIIARELDISSGTVKVHVKNLMRKLNVHSRLEVAVWVFGFALEKALPRGGNNEYS